MTTRSVYQFLDVEVKKSVIKMLVEESQPIAKSQQMVHKRSGKLRQFESELKPETTEILTQKLAPVLSFWGWI